MAARRAERRSSGLASTPDKGRARPRLRLFLAALGVAAVAVGGAVAWRSGLEYVRTSPRFSLSALEVRGLDRLEGSQVLAASGLAEGDNIFCVDLDTVAARVDSMVWIRSARVGRRPPDRLVVHVEERRREVWLELDGVLFGADGDGVLLPAQRRSHEGRAELDLPVLRLPAAASVREGTAAPQPGMALADSALVALIGWWREARLANARACASISEIEPLSDGGVRLFLVADGLEVRMPMAEAGEHLAVLQELLDRVYRECPDAAYVDLRYTGQAVVGRRGTASHQELEEVGHG